MPLHLEPGDGPPSFPDLLAAAGYRAMAAALRLGVFGALVNGPLPAPELAAELDVDPRGAGLLAEALVAFGYLEHVDGGYANTEPTRRWLSGPGYRDVDQFWAAVLFESWDGLEESLRTGRPALDFYGWLAARPETLHRFQGMLSGLADTTGAEVAGLVPVGASVLDLGGGHAKYAIRLCAEHPALRATVVDLPDALEVGRRAVDDAGLADRITLRAGDYDEIDLGADHDAVLLFNVVHGRGAAANRVLLGRVAAALRPGGVVALLELDEHAEDPSAEAFARVFSLNLFHGQGGQVYGAAEIGEWLAGAGFADTTTHPLRSAPGQSLTIARKR
ncbi:methyltransferase [Saccharothrix obliqua]|uniref:methyltransferase n=1 Tax=Saccharothrix obliqua TaxID=2861747 RepID=UPI001C5D288B|nr:methyltransferase [Saccharothrix obliqua]MBW4717935.1 methyltransferase domain-containing protein [Saccharothrix obliqua]